MPQPAIDNGNRVANLVACKGVPVGHVNALLDSRALARFFGLDFETALAALDSVKPEGEGQIPFLPLPRRGRPSLASLILGTRIR